MSFLRSWSLLPLLASLSLAACGQPPRVARSQPPVAARAPAPEVASVPAEVTPAVAAPPVEVETPEGPRVELSAATTPGLVRTDKEQEILVRVQVHALALHGKKRPPLNLALVVDTSGSMDGAPIVQARAACALLLDLLSDGDTASIVTFGSRAKVVVESVQMTPESRARAKAALGAIAAEGTTDMAAGLTEGLAQVRSRRTAESVNRIVLVGDGVPNDAAPVLALADRAKAEHVPVTTLGLGDDFDETLMAALAQRSSGTFHFVNEASRVGDVFKEQISRLDRVVARGAVLQITPGPGVTVKEIIATPASITGRGLMAQIGDLTESQTRELFVRVTAKGQHDGKSMELVDARLTFTPTEGGAVLTADTFVKLAASTDAARLKDSTVTEIEHGATTLRVAQGTVNAIAQARNGDLVGARKLLEATLQLAKEGEKKFADKALGKKVTELTKLRATLASLAPRDPGGWSPNGAPSFRQSVAPARPAAPGAAMDVRAAHGDAMKVLQGD